MNCFALEVASRFVPFCVHSTKHVPINRYKVYSSLFGIHIVFVEIVLCQMNILFVCTSSIGPCLEFCVLPGSGLVLQHMQVQLYLVVIKFYNEKKMFYALQKSYFMQVLMVEGADLSLHQVLQGIFICSISLPVTGLDKFRINTQVHLPLLKFQVFK